jgi:hypothetical protein
MSKMSKSMKTPMPDPVSDSDTSDSDIPVTSKAPIKKAPIKKAPVAKTPIAKKEPVKKAPIVETEPESSGDEIKIPDSEPESSDEEKEMKAKKRDKKTKETYQELFDRLRKTHLNNIESTKQYGTILAHVEKQFKESKVRDRETEKLLELMEKAHSEAVMKAANSRPKRISSGFKAKPLPTYLYKFLSDNGQVTPEETALGNPKVLSKLNSIFAQRECREGKNIYLDDKTCKDLYLDKDTCTEWDLYDDDKRVVIRFEKFGKFVSRLINRTFD